MSSDKPTGKDIIRETMGAVGSNAPRTKPNVFRWFISHPKKMFKQIAALLIGYFLMTNLHWFFGIIFLGALIWIIYHWWGTFRIYRIGDINPGKVIHLNPDRIAVTTNMTKGFGNFPIIRILEVNLRKEDKVLNKIIPTLASYYNNPHGYPFWSEFHPFPINHGISNKEELQKFANSYTQSEIDRIDEFLDKIHTHEPETYKIDVETSGWKDYRDIVVGNLHKMIGPKDRVKTESE